MPGRSLSPNDYEKGGCKLQDVDIEAIADYKISDKMSLAESWIMSGFYCLSDLAAIFCRVFSLFFEKMGADHTPTCTYG